MLISRTPYRVSFFGGGTDYPVWFRENGGAALSVAIDRHCYLTCRYAPPFNNYLSRVVWSKIEQVQDNREIDHPAVNAGLKYLGITQGVDINYIGDLPARSGLGSSSAFMVGLLNALHALRGARIDKDALAREAIHVERDLLGENVGVQDQIQTAFGGINHMTFNQDGGFQVDPLPLSAERREMLRSHMMLFFTGVARTASTIAGEKIRAIPEKGPVLRRMQEMVAEGRDILLSSGDMGDFGELLHEGWQLKKSISSAISSNWIDEMYAKARQAGAYGGKLLGAGGGGFMLFFAPPERHQAILDALAGYIYVPIEFDHEGSRIIFYSPQNYSQTVLSGAIRDQAAAAAAKKYAEKAGNNLAAG